MMSQWTSYPRHDFCFIASTLRAEAGRKHGQNDKILKECKFSLGQIYAELLFATDI